MTLVSTPCRTSRAALVCILAATVAALPGTALAHTEVGVAGGLLSGFLHPLLGPDHLVAMVAVGLWGAQLGRPLIWALPIAFPLMMAVGGMLGVLGFELPGVELGIAASGVVLGLVVALALRAAVPIAVALVAAFAVLHGYAHGVELPAAANPLAYGIGFVVATGLLHLAGIAIGRLNGWRVAERPAGSYLVRGCGLLVTLAGGYYVAGYLGGLA
jgi:urease accessory protein